jgi:hypothetical protein
VDVLVDDPDAADGDVPDLLVLEFAFPGGRKLSRAELDRRHQGWLDRAATKRSEVARLVEVFAPDYPGVNSENTKVRERAERELEAWAAFVALATEDSRMYSAPQAGRIGYVKLVPDIDWPVWTPVEGARELLAAVDEFWPAKCATYQELADALTASNLMTLSGKPFTKASVMNVLIAARLVSGSHPPWK